MLRLMWLEGVSSNDITYLHTLKPCGSKLYEIHMGIVQGEFDTNPYILIGLVDWYAKCGPLSEGLQTFDRLCDKRSIVSRMH